jgi:hypothetical protein
MLSARQLDTGPAIAGEAKGRDIMLKQEIEDGTRSFADPAFRADVIDGLTRRPRAIPGRLCLGQNRPGLFLCAHHFQPL